MKTDTTPIRIAGLETKIQENIHEAAKAHCAAKNKSLAELIEAGLQQQLDLGVVNLKLGIVIDRLRQKARFYDATEHELDPVVKEVLRFTHPSAHGETVQDMLEEYAVWSKMYNQVKAETREIATSILLQGVHYDGMRAKGKYDQVAAELSDRLGQIRVQQLDPLLDAAVEYVTESY